MDRTQKNSQLMGNAVSQTNTNYNATWSTSPLFVGTSTEHDTNMTNIAECEVKQLEAMEVTGLVQSKNLIRELLIIVLTRIIAGVRGFANASGNKQLAASVNLQSQLHTCSDTKFLTIATGILKAADANALAIEPYGISTQVLTNARLDVNAFESILKKPQSFRGQVKVYTADLRKFFTVMRTHLRDNMDNQVRSLYAGTDFLKAYFNSRKTYNYNQNPTILRGTVTNADGHHVKNAVIELVDYPSPNQNTFRNTNTKGNFAFKQLDLISATLRVRALGYTVAEYTVKVTKNKTTDFDIQLLPEPAPVFITA